jgi:hypothetical protein
MAQRVSHVVRQHVSEPFRCEHGQRVGVSLDELVCRNVLDLGEVPEEVTRFPRARIHERLALGQGFLSKASATL